jgi:hypothetical protein
MYDRPNAGEETRVARIDPATGAELPSTSSGSDGDATIVGKPLAAGERARTVTVELLPPADARATGEITACWSDRRSRAPSRLLGALAARLGRPGSRTRVLALVLLGAALAIGTWIAGSPAAAPAEAPDGSASSSPPPAAAPAPAPATVVAEPTPSTPPPVVEQPAATAPDPALRRAAVDALVDGRLADARRSYRQLSEANPSDESFALALQILARHVGSTR